MDADDISKTGSKLLWMRCPKCGFLISKTIRELDTAVPLPELDSLLRKILDGNISGGHFEDVYAEALYECRETKIEVTCANVECGATFETPLKSFTEAQTN